MAAPVTKINANNEIYLEALARDFSLQRQSLADRANQANRTTGGPRGLKVNVGGGGEFAANEDDADLPSFAQILALASRKDRR